MPTRYFAMRDDRFFTAADFVAGVPFTTNMVDIPTFEGEKYFGFAVELGFVVDRFILDTGWNQDTTEAFESGVIIVIGERPNRRRLMCWISEIPFYDTLSGHAFELRNPIV